MLRTTALTILLTAALSGMPPVVAQTRTPASAPVEERDARETRQRLHEMLGQYPPSVTQVLRLDPSLMSKPEYLATYPGLAAFLAQHPEVAHNPAFFVGEARSEFGESSRSQSLHVVQDIFQGAMVLIGFLGFFTLVGWLARNIMQHRTWQRASKVHADAHAKLVDRLTSNEDLLAYVQSPAGQRAMGLMAGTRAVHDSVMQPVIAPVNRILWSMQAGVVIAAAGIGLWFAKNNVIEEAAQPLYVVAMLAIALGVGFVVSSIVAYAFSRQLGLLDTEPRSSHA
jgi:hypothetical protein